MRPSMTNGSSTPPDFGRLGTGTEADRLSFRLVVHILWRTLPLLRSVRRHLVTLGVGAGIALIVGLPIALLTTDVLATRVLQGKMLTKPEASFLALDPAVYAHPWPDAKKAPQLTDEQRATVRDRWAIVSIILFLLSVPFFAGSIYYVIWILQKINQTLRVRLLDRIQTLSLRFHAESRVGDSVYRLFQDSAMVTNVIETLFLRPIQFIALHLIGLSVAFALDPLLGLTILLTWPITLLLSRWMSPRLRVRFRGAREANSALTSRIQETVAGIRVIKAYGTERREQELFERDSLGAFKKSFRARNLFMLFGIYSFFIACSALIAGTIRAALSVVGGREVFLQGVLGFLGFTIFNYGLFNFARQRVGQATTAVEQLMSYWGTAQDVAIGLDRVYEILDLEPEVTDRADAVAFEGLSDGVRFRKVAFSYEPGRPILEGIDFEAHPGTITAIVGPTGSGKSTLMALLLRLFDPDDGSIELDGRDLRELQVDSLRRGISIALQENILFGTTVRENIRYAVSEASDEEVEAAAQVAAAHEFIQALPQGYDTLLGERGTKLSSGQRQRLSIARAILKDSPILILDEPTAALDAETELRVLSNLAAWGQGRAIFLVTHRLSTIRRADRILYLREGRVLEFGSHSELIDRPDGAYRRFVELEDAMGTLSTETGKALV